jgi:hypothetical protein
VAQVEIGQNSRNLVLNGANRQSNITAHIPVAGAISK